MATLDFPDLPVKEISWSLITTTQTSKSPLNGAVQTLELPGAAWAAEVLFVPLTQQQKRTLAAFLVQLRGQAGRFYLNEIKSGLLGSGSGVPVVDTSVSNTTTLIGSSGWTASATGVLKAGDMIGFSNDELKMVVADVDADVSGQATIQIEPPFRHQPTDATSIVTSSPTCIMRLVDDKQATWRTDYNGFYICSIKCVESWT